MTVAVLPREGLGNQMFWYALGRAEALESGSHLRVNTEWFDQGINPARSFLLDRFALADAPDVTIGRGGGGRIEDPRIGDPSYFRTVRDQLRADFSTGSEPPLSDRVGVHVRRGDFARLRLNGSLLMKPERLKTAMAGFPGRDFRIFSDDPAWCAEHLGGPGVEVMPAGDPVEDLLALAACADLIIANSTFSWWAAWLRRHLDGAVLFPRNWHDGAWPGRPDPLCHNHLIDPAWIAY